MDDYGRRITLDVPFERAVTQTVHALHTEGFDVIATIDVRDYLAQGARHECRRYLLLEALLPQVTLDALQHDIGVGPILPTTIAIFELPDGETAVAASPAFAPVAFDFGWRAARPAIAEIADRVAERLARTFARLEECQHDSAAMAIA
jgi:uncharacterized protein (DUF302 family)